MDRSMTDDLPRYVSCKGRPPPLPAPEPASYEASILSLVSAVRELFGFQTADWLVWIDYDGLAVCSPAYLRPVPTEIVTSGKYLADWLFEDAAQLSKLEEGAESSKSEEGAELSKSELDDAATEFARQWTHEREDGESWW